MFQELCFTKSSYRSWKENSLENAMKFVQNKLYFIYRAIINSKFVYKSRKLCKLQQNDYPTKQLFSITCFSFAWFLGNRWWSFILVDISGLLIATYIVVDISSLLLTIKLRLVVVGRPWIFVVWISTANVNFISPITINTRLFYKVNMDQESRLLNIIFYLVVLYQLTISGTLSISNSGDKSKTSSVINPSKSQLTFSTHFIALGHRT